MFWKYRLVFFIGLMTGLTLAYIIITSLIIKSIKQGKEIKYIEKDKILTHRILQNIKVKMGYL